MSIMMVTSLNTYTKNMEMKMKWQKKQVEKDYTAHETTSADSAVQKQLEDIRESQKDGSAQMAAQIDLKMMSGKRLSAQEMEYLKEHDPETYKKAKAIEMEREAYERELKNCKTKEEVQRVKAAHAAAGLDQVNNIKNNPNIPSGKKLALIKQELAKSTALEDSMRSFVKSGDYKKLPTEAERQKAEKEMEEARRRRWVWMRRQKTRLRMTATRRKSRPPLTQTPRNQLATLPSKTLSFWGMGTPTHRSPTPRSKKPEKPWRNG